MTDTQAWELIGALCTLTGSVGFTIGRLQEKRKRDRQMASIVAARLLPKPMNMSFSDTMQGAVASLSVLSGGAGYTGGGIQASHVSQALTQQQQALGKLISSGGAAGNSLGAAGGIGRTLK